MKKLEVEGYLSILEQTVEVLRSQLTAETDPELKPSRNAWSTAEVLAHLTACQTIWADSIIKMLDNDRPEIDEIHPEKWLKMMKANRQTFVEKFDAFSKARHHLLLRLKAISAEQWERQGMINGRVQTVKSQLRRMALHEQSHWEQIVHSYEQTNPAP